ncbi:flagellar motor protein MotB [Actibacterium sp. 188UL27-1]|uniref:flagellar motor protein MotB n=1 Tax=Actibacterium sp. 188UL27-1 TaxID=2786961 RepID=UPI00195AEC2D|nr:flagellar motor protein MotB [Actibacterium sp. 188UL27-1]MBM7069859.1 chemotaxis protein MotB [Actibacterium sp. 188UL27-1]
MANDGVAPIIIKRKKVSGGDGHHGGAWKVAYADFVTAMMAFFMLMWLLNATTEKQRKGLADYFSPTIPINRASGGGNGAFGGDSIFTEQTLAQVGTGASQRYPGIDGAFRDSPPSDDAEAQLQEAESLLMGRGGESMVSENAMRHVITRVTDEGLIVELFDTPDQSLFKAGTNEPTPVLEELIAMIGRVFSVATNDIAVTGHSRSHAVVLADNPVWTLSVERAEFTRVMLSETGLDMRRFERVTGYADRALAVENPMSTRNNRLEITLLRGDQPPDI